MTRQDQYDSLIGAAAGRYGLSAALVKATIQVESDFNPRAYRAEAPRTSLPPTADFPKGGDASFGLMQLLARTARGLGYTGSLEGLYDPATNIELGAKLLRQNLNAANGNVADSISAYNGGFRPSLGFGKTLNGKYGNQSYVDRVLGLIRAFGGEVEGAATTAVPFRVDPPGALVPLERKETMSALSSFSSARASRDRIEEATALLGPVFWKWYEVHAEDKVLTVKIWFISKTIRVRDVRPVFVLIFGQPPVSAILG